MRRFAFVSVTVVAVMAPFPGCQSTQRGGAAPGVLALQLAQTDAQATDSGPLVRWLATYTAGDKVTRFGIELLLKQFNPDSAFVFTRGAFWSEPGSDGTAFLRALHRTLATTNPLDSLLSRQHSSRLEFPVALTGIELSREKFRGTFQLSPKGDWITTKVFLADGAGEFYLNLSTSAARAEITQVAPGFGSVVVREMSKVVWGSAQ
jgi:hypothetical protein